MLRYGTIQSIQYNIVADEVVPEVSKGRKKNPEEHVPIEMFDDLHGTSALVHIGRP